MLGHLSPDGVSPRACRADRHYVCRTAFFHGTENRGSGPHCGGPAGGRDFHQARRHLAKGGAIRDCPVAPRAGSDDIVINLLRAARDPLRGSRRWFQVHKCGKPGVASQLLFQERRIPIRQLRSPECDRYRPHGSLVILGRSSDANREFQRPGVVAMARSSNETEPVSLVIAPPRGVAFRITERTLPVP